MLQCLANVIREIASWVRAWFRNTWISETTFATQPTAHSVITYPPETNWPQLNGITLQSIYDIHRFIQMLLQVYMHNSNLITKLVKIQTISKYKKKNITDITKSPLAGYYRCLSTSSGLVDMRTISVSLMWCFSATTLKLASVCKRRLDCFHWNFSSD